MLVGKESATHGRYLYHDKKKFHAEGINRNHSRIIQFRDPQDEVYRFKVLPWLKKLQEKGNLGVSKSLRYFE